MIPGVNHPIKTPQEHHSQPLSASGPQVTPTSKCHSSCSPPRQKDICCLWDGDSSPVVKSVPRQCITNCALGVGTQNVIKAVSTHHFHLTKAPQTWSFERELNIEKMAPSCRLHLCQAPHLDNNGSCFSSPRTNTIQLNISLHIPGPPKLLLHHQDQVSICK